MSVKWTTWVWEHSPYDGVKLLIHMCLADWASDDAHDATKDGKLFASYPSIAARARCSTKHVQRTLIEFGNDHYIVRTKKAAQHQAAEYRLLRPEIQSGHDVQSEPEIQSGHDVQSENTQGGHLRRSDWTSGDAQTGHPLVDQQLLNKNNNNAREAGLWISQFNLALPVDKRIDPNQKATRLASRLAEREPSDCARVILRSCPVGVGPGWIIKELAKLDPAPTPTVPGRDSRHDDDERQPLDFSVGFELYKAALAKAKAIPT